MSNQLVAGALQTAAFFRVERNLSARTPLALIRWLAMNAQTLKGRVKGLGGLALLGSVRMLGRVRDEIEVDTPKLQWLPLKGMSQDRLVMLGEEYCERFMIPELDAVASALLESARERGHRIVLVSDNLEEVIRPLAEHLEVDDVICNRLEMDDYRATGALTEPVFSGRMSSKWLRSYARARGIDLNLSMGYGARADDSLLLSALGQPCAVNPDAKLRAVARELDWPVVER